MNKQRKVVITTTYNEMGIIIDTKAEEVAQPNLQLTCNNLATDCISRQAAKDRLTILVNEIEGIFADIRERNVDDSVCGLCEYDCDHGIDGSAFECPGFERDDCFKLKDEYKEEWTDVKALPSAQPDRKVGKWIDHSDDGYVECPFCRSATNCDDNINELHYCFSCGAKMEVVEDAQMDH